MMKKCQIVAEHLGIALGSLTPHRVPFVHVLLADESESNVINNTLSQLFRGNLAYNDVNSYLELQTSAILKTGWGIFWEIYRIIFNKILRRYLKLDNFVKSLYKKINFFRQTS